MNLNRPGEGDEIDVEVGRWSRMPNALMGESDQLERIHIVFVIQAQQIIIVAPWLNLHLSNFHQHKETNEKLCLYLPESYPTAWVPNTRSAIVGYNHNTSKLTRRKYV